MHGTHPHAIPSTFGTVPMTYGTRILLIEDDQELRDAIKQTLASVGFSVSTFENTRLVSLDDMKLADCIILDFWLPYETGLQFLRRVGKDLLATPPVIFLSGHADVRMAIDVMKAGAAELLQKPVRPTDLLEAVNRALTQTGELRRARGRAGEVLERYRTLTAAERRVMALVCSGLKSKQVAFKLKRSENTIKIHRARVMQKMKCRSVVELFEINRVLSSMASEDRDAVDFPALPLVDHEQADAE
jgi:FixJ family two-component response regulator